VNVVNRAIVAAMPLVPRPIVRRIASRYVAGETLDQALETVRALNAEGCMATLDVLGEDVEREVESEVTVAEYLRALDGIAARGLDCNVSVKLTALALKLEPRDRRPRSARDLSQALGVNGAWGRAEGE
jgi:proline dehydrogenase